MTGYVLRRLLLLPAVLLGVSTAVFFMLSLVPGDPALAMLGPYATPQALARLHAELGLDAPLWQRYLGWLGRLLHGDLGRAVSLHRPVLDEVWERLGPTLLLAGSALALSGVAGVAAGAVAAVHHNRWPDRALTTTVLLGISTPPFLAGLLLLLAFAVWLRWLPVSGMHALYGGGGAADVLRHLVLPCVSLALVAGGIIARLTRASVLEVLAQDHIRMARARGLSEGQIHYRHALRGALVAVVPVIGLQAGFLLGGAVYIESVFQWPGLGRMLVDAIASRDVLLAQGGVLVLACAYVLVNLAADLAQHALDPRSRAA